MVFITYNVAKVSLQQRFVFMLKIVLMDKNAFFETNRKVKTGSNV